MNDFVKGFLEGFAGGATLCGVIFWALSLKRKFENTKVDYQENSEKLKDVLVDEKASYKKIVFPTEINGENDPDNSPKGMSGEEVLVYETPELKKEVIKPITNSENND